VLLGSGGLLGGISFLLQQTRLFGIALLSFGLADLLLGVALMREQADPNGISPRLGVLVGIALLLFGVASLLGGLALLYRPEAGQRMLTWLSPLEAPAVRRP
jgi:hypothetical protein